MGTASRALSGSTAVLDSAVASSKNRLFARATHGHDAQGLQVGLPVLA